MSLLRKGRTPEPRFWVLDAHVLVQIEVADADLEQEHIGHECVLESADTVLVCSVVVLIFVVGEQGTSQFQDSVAIGL